MQAYFAGLGVLYWANLKQSVRMAWPWIVAVLLLVVSSLVAYDNLFVTEQDRQNLAQTVGANPAFNVIFGTPIDLLSAEGFTAWRSIVLGGFLSGLMSILVVVKLSRAKEDSGETELIQSSVVGRYTQLAMSVLVAWTASLVLACLVTLVSIAVGAEQLESILFGVSMLAAGMMFAAVAAVSSQIGSHARTVTSYAVSVLGLSYLVRGFADTVDGAEWMADFSPLGWIQRMEVTGANALWPIWIFAAFIFVALVLAFILNSYRDFGQGIIADRPGAPNASLAKTISGLALKLQRSSILGWTLAFGFVGSMFGYMVSSVGESFGDNAGIARFVNAESGLQEVDFMFEFVRTLLSILGIIAAVYGVQAIIRLHSEEMEHRVEPLLSGNAPRSLVFAAFSSLALLGPTLALIVAGIAMNIVGSITDLNLSAVDILAQSALTIPATLVLVSIAVGAIGLRPQLRHAAWLAVGVSFAITILGPILELNDRVMSLSPFWHVSNASAESVSLTQTFVLLAIACALFFVGFWGFRRRDVARV